MAQEFTTYQDGQSAMMIHVVQGEREMVDQCRSLGRFVLTGIPPMTAGAARIRVSYSVDADGLLTVSAREETTGTEQKIEVKPSYGLGEEEMADMLRASMENARADMEWRLLAEARVEAERGLGALDAALRVDGDLLDDDDREALLAAAAEVRIAIGGSDRDVINEAAERLDQASVASSSATRKRGPAGLSIASSSPRRLAFSSARRRAIFAASGRYGHRALHRGIRPGYRGGSTLAGSGVG